MSIMGKLAAVLTIIAIPLFGTAFAGETSTQGAAIMTPVIWQANAPVVSREAWKPAPGVRVASACTEACQRKHNACYQDCDVRYADSMHTADCKGSCDGDKRACRASCR